MKKFTIAVAKKLGYLSAACIILAALLVTFSRVYIPALNNHKPQFEQWASQILDAPVTIKKARFAWYRYQPEIIFYGLTLHDRNSNKQTFHLKKLRVFFSIPQSLWQRKVVLSGLMLSGAEINVTQTSTGELVAKELVQLEDAADQVKASTQETKVNELLGWLLSQPRISLSEIDVHYKGYYGQQRFVTLTNLRIENDGNMHVVLAKAILHQDIPTEVSLVLRGLGEIQSPDNMKVDGYVYFSGLSLSQWAQHTTWRDWQVQNGLGSAKIWFSWEKGALQKVQSIFQVYGVQFASLKTKTVQTINRLSADIGWKRDGDQQILAADDVLLDMQDHLWPVTNLYVLLKPDKQHLLVPHSVVTGYFNINDVLAFLDGFPRLLPDGVYDAIDHLQPSGGINSVSVTFPDDSLDWQKAALQIVMGNVSFQSWNKLPGFRNLTGVLQFDRRHGKARIDSKRLQVNYDVLFSNPLYFDQLLADMSIDKEAGAWVLRADNIKGSSAVIDFEASGSARIKQDATPFIDLKGSFNVKDIHNVSKYLPAKIFSPGLNKWLASAFTAGYAYNGSAVVQGPLDQFPFTNGGGKFNITTDVKDVTLRYAPDWPALTSVDARVEFIGDKVNIVAANTKILGIDTGVVTAAIPSLGDDKVMLNVTTKNIPTDFMLGIRVIRLSPLQQTIGKMFQDMDVRGPVNIQLGLTVPLSTPEDTSVNGSINLDHVNLTLVPWHLQIGQLNGNVRFTEKTTDSDLIKGVLFGKPLTLSLKTISKRGADSVIQASTRTNLAVHDLEDWLKVPFSKVISGDTDINADINISLDKPLEIHLDSNLLGVKVDLPAPYAKPATDKIKFSSDILIADKQPLKIRMDYGGLLNSALTLDVKNDEFKLRGVDLRIGEGVAEWPEGKGLYITGHIPRLDMPLIKSYLSQSSSATVPGLDLKKIDITVKLVQILGQELDNVDLQIKPASSSWDIVIISDDVTGQVNLPAKMNSNAVIKARFDKLDLDVSESNVLTDDVFDVKSLPRIDFSAANVDINDMLLGEVSFNLVPSKRGMEITSLLIHSPFMDLQASGDWIASGQSSKTELNGVLTSKNASDFLKDLGYNINNFIATKGTLKFDLSWPAMPFAPDFTHLSGNASLDMGSGRIVDVGEENDAKMDLGKMLSIFSLQSIPRRLSLDFSDLVEKGYSFDTLKGTFKLAGGNIFTNDSRFEGPVADVGIKGRIGVEEKDVNLNLSVTPRVASSLPIAATIIGGPVAGIASLAVNSVVSAAVSTVATHEYLVKGKWDNPEWSTVEPVKPVLHRR